MVSPRSLRRGSPLAPSPLAPSPLAPAPAPEFVPAEPPALRGRVGAEQEPAQEVAGACSPQKHIP